jgi:hypothetical protein
MLLEDERKEGRKGHEIEFTLDFARGHEWCRTCHLGHESDATRSSLRNIWTSHSLASTLRSCGLG